MDGFQSISARSALDARTDAASCDPSRREAWDKAMRRFQRSLVAVKAAFDAHGVVEKDMFAARKTLEALPFPACLTVVTEVEVFIKDGPQPALHSTSTREARLITQGDIAAYVGEDEAAYSQMREALQAYNRRRGVLAGALHRAEAICDAKYDLAIAALDRSDAHQRKLLRTPSPTFKELCWKIDALHRAACESRIERKGWAFVLEELGVFAAGVEAAT